MALQLRDVVVEMLAVLLALGVWFCAMTTVAMWFLLWAYGMYDEMTSWVPEPAWMDYWGKTFLLQSAPIVLGSILASAYLAITPFMKPKSLWRVCGAWLSDLFSRVLVASKWTNGIITPGFILGYAVLLFPALTMMILICTKYVPEVISDPHWDFIPSVACRVVYYVGIIFGCAAFYTSIMLLLPVCRTSSILRMCSISYECGVAYHRILGYWTMALTLLHGVLIYIGWIDSGNFWHYFFDWSPDGISNLAGNLAGLCALAIFVTALPWVRRRFFEVFLYTHMLYVVFFVFLAFHCAAWAYPYMIGAMCLFLLDWSIRTVQSWNTVVPSSIRCLPDGCISLSIPLSPGARYKALDVVYVKVPAISMLQWHPFSIASSPAQNASEATLIIKPLGSFTERLCHMAEEHCKQQGASLLHPEVTTEKNSSRSSNSSQDGNENSLENRRSMEMSRRTSDVSAVSGNTDTMELCRQSSHAKNPKTSSELKLKIEGPYSLEHDFLQRYDALLLIAGGVGITPILSLLSELAARMKHRARGYRLPSHVLLVWSMRDASSLAMLGDSGVDMDTLTQAGTDDLENVGSSREGSKGKPCKVHLKVVVTGGSQRLIDTDLAHGLQDTIFHDTFPALGGTVDPQPKTMLKPQIGAGGHELLMALATIIFSTVVLGVVLLFLHYVTNTDMVEEDGHMHSTFNTAWATVILTLAIGLGTIVGVPLVYLLWTVLLWIAPRNSSHDTTFAAGADEKMAEKRVTVATSLGEPGMHVVGGPRPDFKDEFEFMDTLHAHVGVIVSGPSGLDVSVGKKVQKKSKLIGKPKYTLHSLSFNV